MTRNYISKILGYVLFAVAAVMLVGMFYNTSSMGRTGSYYRNEVFPLYKEYDQNDDYFKGYMTASNTFYDQDPIYTFSKHDDDKNELHFTMNIYRSRSVYTENKLYFFKKTQIVNGFTIEIKDLEYKGEDLMELNRNADDDPSFVHYLKVHLEFDPITLPNVSQTDNAYSYTLVPAYPAIINDLILDLNDNTFATLKSIQIYYYPQNEKKEIIESEKELLFVASDGSIPIGDANVVIRDDNLDLSRSNYLITNSEVAGAFPTEEEMGNANFYYKELDLSPYNQSVILTTLAVVGVVILAGYFIFGHKYVKNLIHQKRTEKKLATTKADSMVDSNVFEADFDEIKPNDKVDNKN